MSGDNQLTLTTLPHGLDHPEAVAWGPDGKLYAGGEAGQVYRIDVEAGTMEEFANTDGFVLGMAHDAAGNIYACDEVLAKVMKVTPDGEVSVYSDGSAEEKFNVPNYPVFDAEGNLYVSDSGAWGEQNGRIWRVRPGGEGEVWCTTANGFTNGMCLAGDGRALYVVESSPPLVSRVAINKDGSVGERSVVVELPRNVPDGVALDVEGNLYISLFNPNIIYRYTTDGELQTLYDDWEQLLLIAPTNVAFGGADMKTLFIASLCGWNVNSAHVETPGLPVQYPQL